MRMWRTARTDQWLLMLSSCSPSPQLYVYFFELQIYENFVLLIVLFCNKSFMWKKRGILKVGCGCVGV